MNERMITNRKREIAEAVRSGKDIRTVVAPGELLALIGHTDPVSYDRGADMFCQQVGLQPEDLFEYQLDEQLSGEALEIARNSFLMDSTREKINRHKYTNGLIPDDEIIAFAMFLVSDADIISSVNDYGEVEFDDVSDLVNHIARRIKYLLLCIQNGRYDLLNAIIQFVKRNKTDSIDTLFLFPTVETDDGGVVEFYKAWTDSNAYNAFHEKECAKRMAAYEAEKQMRTLVDDEEDDESDECEDYEEPLVERDFEG